MGNFLSVDANISVRPVEVWTTIRIRVEPFAFLKMFILISDFFDGFIDCLHHVFMRKVLHSSLNHFINKLINSSYNKKMKKRNSEKIKGLFF